MLVGGGIQALVSTAVSMKHRICRSAVTAAVTAKLHFCAGCFQGVSKETAVLDWLPKGWFPSRFPRKPWFSGSVRTAQVRSLVRTEKRHLLALKTCQNQGSASSTRAREMCRWRWRRRSPQQGDNQLPARPLGRASPTFGGLPRNINKCDAPRPNHTALMRPGAGAGPAPSSRCCGVPPGLGIALLDRGQRQQSAAPCHRVHQSAGN